MWGTHKRHHWITPSIEITLIGLIQHKSQELRCPIHAINTMPDHVHIVVSIRPNVAVAKWVKDVKGFSSYQVNQLEITHDHFRWQTSYGVLTYGKKVIPKIIAYVENQKQHHANDDVYVYLERTGSPIDEE